MRHSLRLQAVGVLAVAALGVITGLGVGNAGNAATQKAEATTKPRGPVESLATVKGKFIQRQNKLQNFSVTFTRDDILPALKKEDHWECEARYKAGAMFNLDVRVKAEKADAVGYAPADRLEKWMWLKPKLKPSDFASMQEVDVLTPAGGGPTEAVTGQAWGTLEQQGLDLFEALGLVWQSGFKPITPADLSRAKSQSFGEVQTTWTRVDDDHVTISATDPGSNDLRMKLTLDRNFGYAVVEARQDWGEQSKDYSVLKAEQFEEVGGVMVPMVIMTLHRGAGCHGDYDAVRNTYRIKAWVLNDPKNTMAMKPTIPQGVKAEDRKAWEERKFGPPRFKISGG